MRIANVVPVYNRERFIAPFLEQMSDFKTVVVLGEKHWPGHIYDKYEKTEPDRSEELINKFDVELIKGTYPDMGSQITAGLSRVKDYDLAFVLDCDCFFLKEDLKKLIEYCEQNPADVYQVNYHECYVDFFGDWYHGSRNKYHLDEQPDTIIVNPKKVKFTYMRQPTLIQGDGFRVHTIKNPPTAWHFRMKYEHNTPPDEKYDWITAPKEIIDLYNKWNELKS